MEFFVLELIAVEKKKKNPRGKKCNRQEARAGVLEREVFVLEFVAINGCTSRAVALHEIAALKEKKENPCRICRHICTNVFIPSPRIGGNLNH